MRFIDVFNQEELDKVVRQQKIPVCYNGDFVVDNQTAYIYSGHIKARGFSLIMARGSSSVRIFGPGKVLSRDSAYVDAQDYTRMGLQKEMIKRPCSVVARDSSSILIKGASSVEAYNRVTVKAYDTSTVIAHDNVVVKAWDLPCVEAHDDCTVEAHGGYIEAYEDAQVRASENAFVVINGSKKLLPL